jgi:erythronate-4-phosphate dehydrogenase
VKIVADENIPFAREAFASLGDLRLLPAANLAAELREADALVVRSVTRVNEALLANTRLHFVGTVTAGIDHVDTDCLAKRGITFASAAGCNSTAVAQHVAAFLCALREVWDERRSRTIGIIGVGHCGTKVATIAEALGFETVLCDPPLARQTGDTRFRPLSDLKGCDVITLHTPLIHEGQDRTADMIDEAYLSQMKPGGILLNPARGELVVEKALVAALKSRHLAAAALDVWQGEPQIDLAVLDAVTLGTPHVAGYSHEGRGRGTEMIHTALSEYLGMAPHWSSTSHVPKSDRTIRLACEESMHDVSIAAAVLTAHPIQRTDAELRRLSTFPRNERAPYFENLRKNSMRHEFSAFSVQVSSLDPSLTQRLLTLGFPLR